MKLCRLHFFGVLLASAPVAVAVAVDAATPIWESVHEIAEGGGVKGPWRQNESRYDYVDDATVAFTGRREMVVAWVDQARKDVFFQRFSSRDAKELGKPVNVSRNPATFSWLPRIAVAPDASNVYVLWQEIIFSGGSHGGDILFARSRDRGATFSDAVNLSQSVAGAGKGRISRDYWHNGSLDIAAGADGAVYVAWTEYEGRLWFGRSGDGGRRFAPLMHVAGEERMPARGPALALARDGTIHLAWTVGEDEGADIRIATSRDGGGSFDEPRLVAPSAGYSDAPKLAVDGRGVLHMVYGESSGGPLDPYQVLYTYSTDSARTFAPARIISNPLPRRLEGAGFPALGIDASDRLYVLWELFPDHRAHPRGLGFVISRVGGRQFAPPTVVPNSADPAGGSNGSHQGLLMDKLAVSEDGAIAIVNSSLKQGERSRIWLMRGKLAPPDVRR